jgi:hypothetical protein
MAFCGISNWYIGIRVYMVDYTPNMQVDRGSLAVLASGCRPGGLRTAANPQYLAVVRLLIPVAQLVFVGSVVTSKNPHSPRY